MDSKAWRWIESRLQEFSRNWSPRQRPDIDQFLKSAESETEQQSTTVEQRDWLLAEVIKIDLCNRWRFGGERRAEEYLSQYPHLPEKYHDQIVEAEIEARIATGQPPSLKEIESRFPQQVGRWQRWLDSMDDSTYLPDTNDTYLQSDTIPALGTITSKGHLHPGDTLTKYTLRKELGRGSFAVVWLADDSELRRPVAIKLILPNKLHLDQTLVPRLLREARAVALVDHPGVVQVHEIGQDKGLTFIVEQYVDGPPLTRLIRRGDIEMKTAVEIVREVALAAHAAHECGIIHRDIKPGNILLGSDEKPRLVDFGLAAFETQNEITLTRQGDMLGTPAYMSPQQALGQNHLVDCRTDVYSLGAVLYHMLVGQVPFRGTTLSVLNAVVNQPASSLFRPGQSVPKDLQTIILRCLEKEPTARFESAADLAEDLNRYLAGEPILARPIGLLERLGKWIRRRPRVAALLAVGFFLATILLVSLWQLGNVSRQRNVADRLKQEAQTEMIQKTIVAGQLAMERGRMQEATAHLNSVFSQESQIDIAPVVRLDLVECLLATRDIEGAQSIFASIDLGTIPGDLQGRSKILQAQLIMERKLKPQAAEKLFQQALSLPISNALADYVRAMLADTTRQAILELRRSLSADPLHHQSHRMLCILLFSLADFELAEQCLDDAVALFPEDEDFGLMRCALLAATERYSLATEQLAAMNLPNQDQETWSKILQRLKTICTEYAHRYSESEATDFTLAAMAEIAKDYLRDIHPEFVRRGFQFPPKIAVKFSDLVTDLDLFFQLELQEDDLAPTIEKIVSVHPESSLGCWLGGKQISMGEIEKAKESFLLSTRNAGFVADTRLMSWKGLFATSVALWHRNVDQLQQYRDGVQSLKAIEEIPGGVEGFMETPQHVRTISIFLIEAMRAGEATEEMVILWLNRAEDCHALTKVSMTWSLAVIANVNGRQLDALEYLAKVEELDPDHNSVPAEQVQGMRESIQDRIAKLPGSKADLSERLPPEK